MELVEGGSWVEGGVVEGGVCEELVGAGGVVEEGGVCVVWFGGFGGDCG